MIVEGVIQKMISKYADPVSYFLSFANTDALYSLNEFIGHSVSLNFEGEIHCLSCGKKIKKTYGQGYCYPCFISIPEAEECVLRPELCRAHEGIARNMDWARQHCLQEHVVYLAETSAVKVGVTRRSQVPFRWIDQGASRVLELARTPNRYEAGRIEVFLKQYMPDKTNWRDMLTNKPALAGMLEAVRQQAISVLPSDMKAQVVEFPEIINLKFPVKQYPSKVNSVTLDKKPQISGILTGIRGQYLMFDESTVINIRSHGGYKVKIEIS
jgi:hypothetical protein